MIPNLDGLLPFFQKLCKVICVWSVESVFSSYFSLPLSRFESRFSQFSVNFSFNKCVKGFVLSVQIMTPLPNG